MTFDYLTVQPLRIPMKVRFAQANQDTRTSDSLLVCVYTKEGIVGYGECCPRSYVTGETTATASEQLLAVASQLKDLSWNSFADVCEYLQNDMPEKLGPAATCGLEMALLDSWGRIKRTSVATAFGCTFPDQIEYSGVVPMSGKASLEPLIRHFGFGAMKVKVGSDLAWNLERIAWLRSLVGEEVDLRVDANAGWSIKEAREQIPALLKVGIRSFEQPLSPSDDSYMPALARSFGPAAVFMADESLTTLESAKRLIEQGGFGAFNFKLSKHGGLLRSQQIYRLATKHGIRCQLGAHFGETSLLTAAGLLFGAMVPTLTHREGALGTWLLEEDICEQSLKIGAGGRLWDAQAQLAGPGWGFEVRGAVKA